MAEPRRIQLTTVTPVEKEKKKKPEPKTIRIKLTLNPSTDTTCPEFSYTELTRNEVGEVVSQDGSSTNPFGDEVEDEKLAAIAKVFEEKYAPKPKKSRKGGYHDHLEDLVDLGEGYDEEDPFIDNAEAYDEVVPVCMTTTLGGFYINSGLLDFKYQSDDSVDDFQSETSGKKKKKVKQITSDTDSESGEVKKLIKKRKLKEGKEGGIKKKKRLLSVDGKKLVKNKLVVQKLMKTMAPTVKELLKDQSASTSPVDVCKINGEAAPVRPVDGRGDASNPTIGSTLDALLEQAMKDDSSQDIEEGMTPVNPDTIPPLPLNIPEPLTNMLKTIKAAAQKRAEGKCKFFTNDVNNMLLRIEVCTRQLSCGQRSSIYANLAAYLPCSKDTLLKRAKKLRLNEVDDKIRSPINKLREAVNKAMPALLEKYEAECQIALLARQEDKGKVEVEKEKEADGSTESDEEDKTSGVADGGGEKGKKRVMGPRKRFEWNPDTRNCLLELVKAKMQCYDMLKTRMQSAEEYLRGFLNSEIRPIWPQGWIQTRMLYKESRAAHSSWTNPQKLKKVVTGSKSFTNSPVGSLITPATKSLLNNGDRTTITSNVIEITGEKSQQKNVATILDYAEYTDKVSPPGKNSINSNITSNQPTTSALNKQSTRLPGNMDATKSKDSSKHHLVSDILQKPLSVVTGSLSPSSQLNLSPKSPQLTNPNPKDSTFFLEFQKHLSKQLSPNALEKVYGAQNNPNIVSSTSSTLSSNPVKTHFKSPSSTKYVDPAALKSSEAIQKQLQAQMTKAQHQARQAVAVQQKQSEHQLLAEMQFQKAYIASVQSNKGTPPQLTKQFSPKTTMASQSQNPKPSSQTGRDQILAQIQAELGRGEPKIKYKQPEPSKITQKIIDDAVMQQMFKQPLPATSSSLQQKPLLQQALRATPVLPIVSSPSTNTSRQSPGLAHLSPGSRPMTSLLSPTSRSMNIDLTTDSPPKNRTSLTIVNTKKTSPTNILQHEMTRTSPVQRPGYIMTSPSLPLENADRTKVFMQPQVRQTSILNTSSNKNMQAQWNTAFGVSSGQAKPSAFTPPVTKTVSAGAQSVSDPKKSYLPAPLTYNEICEVLGVQQSTGHIGSTTQALQYNHSTPLYTTNTCPQPNPSLLYQHQHGSNLPSILSPTLQYGHLPYTDTSQKPHGQ